MPQAGRCKVGMGRCITNHGHRSQCMCKWTLSHCGALKFTTLVNTPRLGAVGDANNAIDDANEPFSTPISLSMLMKLSMPPAI